MTQQLIVFNFVSPMGSLLTGVCGFGAFAAADAPSDGSVSNAEGVEPGLIPEHGARLGDVDLEIVCVAADEIHDGQVKLARDVF